jgi:hypothetical protein
MRRDKMPLFPFAIGIAIGGVAVYLLKKNKKQKNDKK